MVAEKKIDRHKYMASREWGLKKRAVNDRAGGICERCHDAAIENTHHLFVMPFWGECGHHFEYCFGYHKGYTVPFWRPKPTNKLPGLGNGK